MTLRRIARTALIPLAIAALTPALAPAQTPAQTTQPALDPDAGQTAHLLGLDPLLRQLQASHDQPPSASSAPLRARQQLSESIQSTALDVDSVLSELDNERAELESLRTILQARRDRKVNRLTTAALLTGSGAGTAVSATQFTTLSSTTQNVGDALGIGSGAASTLLSILAARAQAGPRGVVQQIPNMLAPLLGGTPVLHSSYPPEVLAYLHTIPAEEDPTRGSRLDQLLAEWNLSGRLNATDSPTRQRQLLALTSSNDPDVKITIDQISDRMALLTDVRGRVSLIKRDLAAILRSCTSVPQ